MRGAPFMVAAALALAACAPQLPKGVSPEALDTAINGTIGDPNTCVLIGGAGTGRTVYQFGSHVSCGKAWPTCAGVENRTTDGLLKSIVRGGAPVLASCSSNVDGSRAVGWAGGPIEGHPEFVYAATMEGKDTPPGVVIADKLKAAFKAAGL
jgi:hypothetical protein